MKKRASLLIISIFLLIAMNGCISFIPNLSDEDEKTVTNYMADQLLMHSSGYERRLLAEEEVESALNEEVTARENAIIKKEEEQKKKEEAINESKPDDIEVVVPEKTYAISDLASLLELDSFAIDYLGYEVKDSYPDVSDGETLVFAMTPSEGKELLILKFNVSNISGSDASLKMGKTGASYRIAVNGDAGKPPLTTLLEEEFCHYDGTLPTETGVQLVMITEISEGEEINSLDLNIKVSSRNIRETISLQ